LVLRISTPPIKLDAQRTKKIKSSSSETFSVEVPLVSSPKTTAPVSQTRSMQQDDSPTKRGLKKGKNLLDALDQLKLSLITGATPDLSAIKKESLFEEEVEDEKLQNILSEIETRAAVELAKLEN